MKASSHFHTFGVFNESGVANAGLSQYFSQAYGTEHAHSFGTVRFGCGPITSTLFETVSHRGFELYEHPARAVCG